MQKKKKYFKIGEVSRLFHIGVDSIRYYEEIGILKPYRNPDNNYRLYTLDDLRKLTIIRELLSLNFSTEEIKQFEESRTVNSTIALFEKELNLINERIVDLLQQKDNILARISDIQNTLSLKEQQNIRLLDLPERHCIMVSPTNIPDSYLSYSLMEYMQSHPQRVDTIGTCDCYTLDIEGSNPDSDYYRTESSDFSVHCYVQEGSESLIDLSFSVPTEEEAEKVCANWPERSQETYMYILKKLL